MFIPNGDFVINGGDRISVVAKPEIAAKFFKRISIAIGRSKDVILSAAARFRSTLQRRLLNPVRMSKLLRKIPNAATFFRRLCLRLL